ncbi:MAG: D-glucuronyl C5-epimerase family protein [Thermoleophilia bacterium]
MRTGQQIAVVLAAGVVAGLAGFGGAALIDNGNGGAAASPAVSTAPPDEALLDPAEPVTTPPPRPAPVATTPLPQPAPPLPDPEPEPEPEPEPTTEAEPAPPPPATTEPETETKPPPAPTTTTTPRAPSAPSTPPARATAPVQPAPQGIRIPPGQTASGFEPARRELATALSRAAAGSDTASDIRRLLSMWKAYLGPDAVNVPEGRRQTVARALRDNAWWYARRAAPVRRVLLVDEQGVILTYRRGHGFAVNPVATTGRWQGLNEGVPVEQLAETMLQMGVRRSAGGRDFLSWEYYDELDDPSALVPGVSGMAQARLALVMAHAYDRTHDPRFAEAVRLTLASFSVDVNDGGVRSMVRITPDQPLAPWYVERAYPGASPWKGGALNGFMVTILNLRGTASLLEAGAQGDPDVLATVELARSLADQGAATLDRHLPDHDSGSWSYYAMLTPGRPWRSYFADLNYHCYHIRLLKQLATPYPDLDFARYAVRWQGYVDRAGVSCPVR